MRNFLLAIYVYMSTKQKKMKVKDKINLLNKELEQFDQSSIKLRYDFIFMLGTTLNATAILPKTIIINSAWIKKIIFDYDNPIMHDAFLMTINHEMTHKEKNHHSLLFKFKRICYSLYNLKNDRKFFNWVDEVHADFGGINKAFDGNRNKAISIMEYKLISKKTDEDTKSHPSWKKRITYVSNYDFNEKLIDKIANDCNCMNEKLISLMKNYYGNIILK